MTVQDVCRCGGRWRVSQRRLPPHEADPRRRREPAGGPLCEILTAATGPVVILAEELARIDGIESLDDLGGLPNFLTANRDEFIHLIEGLPDDQVEVVLADVRRPASERSRGEWPPAFFGAGVAKDGRTDIARNVDEYLAEGFGRRRA